MPEIPEYNAPIKGLTVPATGIEAMATAGRRLGQLGNERASMIRQEGRDIGVGLEQVGRSTEQLGDAQNRYDTSQDLNYLHSHFTNQLINLNQAWDKYLQDPAVANDPGAIQKFQDQYVQPAIDQMTEGVQTKGGRQAAAELGKTLGTHFAQVGQQVQAHLAGQQIAQTYQQMYNGLGVSVQQHPETLPIAMTQLGSYLNSQAALHPELTPDKVKENLQKARADLTLGAGKGFIDQSIKNGTDFDVDAWAQSHATDLGPNGLTHLKTYQRQEQQHINTLDKANDAEQKKTDEAEFNFVKNTAIQRLMDGGSAANFLDEIKRANTLPGAVIHQNQITEMYNFGKEWAKDNSKDQTADTTRNELYSHLLSGDLDQRALIRFKAEHSISDPDFKFFMSEVGKQDTQRHSADAELLKSMDADVKSRMGYIGGEAPSPEAANAYFRWSLATNRAHDAAQRAGKSTSEFMEQWNTPERLQTFWPQAKLAPGYNPGSGLFPNQPAPTVPAGGAYAPLPVVPEYAKKWFGPEKK